MALLVMVGASACVPQAPSVQGRAVNQLYGIFAVIASIIFVVTAALIALSMLRYRAKPSDDALPAQFEGNVKLELIWFAIPTVIVVVLFILTLQKLDVVTERAPDPESIIEVDAYQWGWSFTYRGEGVNISGGPHNDPELVVPIDRAVAFEISAEDVQHSFYLPRLLIKRDAIPGRTNRVDVEIDEPGRYIGKCAEFCGLLHAEMNFVVRAVPPLEYRAWLIERKQDDGNA